MTPSRLSHPRSGSALISTMLVITVLTIIVVAFMQSMSIERQTAHSYLNRYKAELAAKAAFESAVAKIESTLPKTSAEVARGFIAWTWGKDATFDVTYTGLLTDIFDMSGTNLGVDRTVWLFSSRQNPTDPEKLDSDPKNQANINALFHVNTSGKSIPVDWLTLPDDPTARFAYWVSDESGRFDLTKLGNSDNITRDTGKLTDLLLPEIPAGEVSALRAQNDLFKKLSVATTLQVAPTVGKSPTSFGVGSNEWNNVINYGPMALQPRTDINQLFTQAGAITPFVNQLDTLVSKALPEYYDRKDNQLDNHGGPRDPQLRNTFKRIAASIYGYLDPSPALSFSPNLETYFQDFTGKTSAWPKPNTADTYYTIKATPRINEYLVYYGTASSTGQYSSSSIDITRTIELWNPSQKPVTIASIVVRLFNQQRGGSAAPPLDETISSWVPSSLQIPANGFTTITNTTRYSATLPSSFESFRTALNSSNTGIILSATVDGGPQGVIDGFSPMQLQGSATSGKAGVSPGYSGSGDTADTRANLGLFLLKWSPVTSTYHSPGQPNNTASDRKYQNMRNWFDQPQVGSQQGVSPTSPPAYIKGGPIDYIGELGNIWDPGKDLTDSTGLVRGGKTLAIGQFDPYYRVTNGTVASTTNAYADYLKRGDAALLDILTASDDPRININAPRPPSEPTRPFAILGSALAFSTAAAFPQATKPQFDYLGVENAVIARLSTATWKDTRPFRTTNDLVTLDNATTFEKLTARPFIGGNTNFWSSTASKLWKSGAPGNSIPTVPSGAMGLSLSIADGDDRAREEAFRRISNWISLTSLTFHIHSAGQILNKQGTAIANAKFEAVVTFVPKVIENADGTTDSVSYTPTYRTLATQ